MLWERNVLLEENLLSESNVLLEGDIFRLDPRGRNTMGSREEARSLSKTRKEMCRQCSFGRERIFRGKVRTLDPGERKRGQRAKKREHVPARIHASIRAENLFVLDTYLKGKESIEGNAFF